MRKEIKLFQANRDVNQEKEILDPAIKTWCQSYIKDVDYFSFIDEVENGGLFFSRSLQLYSLASYNAMMNIKIVNETLNSSFGEIFNGLFSFGQDIFANQFAFDTHTKEIVWFNIETGDREIMAANFEGWLAKLLGRLDYYVGESYVQYWIEAGEELNFICRLVPKKPFVIGGDYDVPNFCAIDFPKYLLFYADLAKQLYNLPDGTPSWRKSEAWDVCVPTCAYLRMPHFLLSDSGQVDQKSYGIVGYAFANVQQISDQ